MNIDTSQLSTLAGKFKGFKAFAAFLILAALALFGYLFPAGSFDFLVQKFGILDKDQFFYFVMAGGMAVFTVIVLLIVYSKTPDEKITAQTPQTPSNIHVTVHEKGDRTAWINDALVKLTPVQSGEGQQKKTNEQGAVNFTIASSTHELNFVINAEKVDYQADEAQEISIKAGHNRQFFIELDPKK